MLSPCQRAEPLLDLLRAEAAETDFEGGFPERSIELLRETGLLRAPLPGAQGGESLGEAGQTLELLTTLAAIGRGSLVVGRLYEGHVNALQLVQRFGTPAQCDRAARDAARGHLFGVWNTEAANGLRLVGEAGHLRFVGSKTFASGLGHVSRALVTAARDGPSQGWQMILLPTDEQRPREDRAFWKPLGMRATSSFAADFSGLEVAPDDLIGAPGDYYREPAFTGGSIRFAAVQQGGAEGVFDETRRCLNALGRTGDPFQRARLGEMAWRIESGRLWLEGAARLAASATEGGEAGTADDRASADAAANTAADIERLVAYARMMRSAIEDNALHVLELALRSVGARGLLRPEPFERMHRDLTHYLRQPAPDGALVEAGRHVLGDSRSAGALWR